MNSVFHAVITATLLMLAPGFSMADEASAFDESAIQAIFRAQLRPQDVAAASTAFEASVDPVAKAAKWEEMVMVVSGGLLAANWPIPQGGWRLLDFPENGTLSLEDVREQPWRKAGYTKLVAQNETEAAQLRAAAGLLYSAAELGEQWASILLLDLVRRPESNMKRLAYWVTSDFSVEGAMKGELSPGVPNPMWAVDWNAWQQAYNDADRLGKAIILRNITMLAVRRHQVTTAAAINLSALSGSDRELKAIALAFGDPGLGSAVTAKWAEIAADASDPQLQALAKELRAKFPITD